VAGVLLEEVEQDPLQGGGRCAVPAVAGLAHLVEVVPGDDRGAAFRLGVQRGEEALQGLVWRHVPAVVGVIAPRVGDGAAFEAPLKPAQLDVRQVLEQLKRRPAGRDPAAPQFVGWQPAQPHR